MLSRPGSSPPSTALRAAGRGSCRLTAPGGSRSASRARPGSCGTAVPASASGMGGPWAHSRIEWAKTQAC
eukprot:2043463-Alexandrium_andersonii.AAC.1